MLNLESKEIRQLNPKAKPDELLIMLFKAHFDALTLEKECPIFLDTIAHFSEEQLSVLARD